MKFDNLIPSNDTNVHEVFIILLRRFMPVRRDRCEGPGSNIFSDNVCIQSPDEDQGESDKNSDSTNHQNLAI